MLDNSKEFWEKQWEEKIEVYLKALPRTGYFIRWLIKKNNLKNPKILEIAGGSCRDSRFLANLGFYTVGSDYEPKLLEYLKNRFSDDPLYYSTEDAFNMTFEDSSFDLTFHNGFIICFDKNRDVKNIITEQLRVTSKFAVMLTHNLENSELREQFSDRIAKDKLYDIRFYDKGELLDILSQIGISKKQITFYKFGGYFDGFFRKRIKRIIPNIFYKFSYKFVPYLYQWQKWENTERIVCLIKK